ncbi:MAG: tetratricopeptide repeat protein [Gaiella sp.]
MKARAIVLAVAAVSAALVVLLGSPLGVETRATTGTQSSVDVGALVEQFSSQSTGSVVARLERDAEARPGDTRLLTLLGLGYLQRFRETGDPSWLGRADAALGRLPAGSADALSLTAKAQLAVVQHRFRDAIPLARRAVRRDPGSAAALGVLGDALQETGRYREAFAVFDRMAMLGPSVGAYARVGFARRLRGRVDAAIDAFELALEAGSAIPEQTAWAEVQYGSLLLSRSRVDDAEAAYRRSLEASPGYVHARAGLARVAVVRGRFGEAARRLQSVVASLPVPQYAILLGDVQRRAGRLRAAARTYDLVGTIERLFAAQGVRTDLQTALFDLDRNHAPATALARARAAYREAPGVSAADAVAWGLVRVGRCREALTWSDRALALGDADALFLFHRGMAERCLGDAEAARSSMRRALALDPGFSVRFKPLAEAIAATRA